MHQVPHLTHWLWPCLERWWSGAGGAACATVARLHGFPAPCLQHARSRALQFTPEALLHNQNLQRTQCSQTALCSPGWLGFQGGSAHLLAGPGGTHAADNPCGFAPSLQTRTRITSTLLPLPLRPKWRLPVSQVAVPPATTKRC